MRRLEPNQQKKDYLNAMIESHADDEKIREALRGAMTDKDRPKSS